MFMPYIVLAALTIGLIEIIIRLPFLATLHQQLFYAKKAVKLIRSATVRDVYKEQLVPAYAFRMLFYSTKLLFLLAAVIGIVVALDWGFSFTSFSLLLLLVQVEGLVTSFAIAMIYLFVRNRFIAS